uniref:RRM domain-containing protein n=1 Tax=Meloidogyne javanica TaxID=6303 RepID=A0A915MNA0_MELJA
MSGCSTHVLRQLINDKAKDPEIPTYQRNTGDAFAFVKLNSEEAANCLIARSNESKLEECDHVHASFIPKFGIACSLVPNALLRGNPVDEFKAAEGPYPCGDGTVERRGHGWEEDDHYDDFTSDPVSWYGHEKFGITDNVESCGTDSSAPDKKSGENNEQQLYASGIKVEREGRVYRSESDGIENKEE